MGVVTSTVSELHAHAQTVDCAGARLGGRVPWGRVNTPTKFGLVGRKSNVILNIALEQ